MSSRLKTKIFIIMLYYKSGSLADWPGELVEGQVPTVTLKNLLRVFVASSASGIFPCLKKYFLYGCFVCIHVCAPLHVGAVM